MITLSYRALRTIASIFGSVVVIVIATPILFWLGRPDPEPEETFAAKPDLEFDEFHAEDFDAISGDFDAAPDYVDAVVGRDVPESDVNDSLP